MNKKNRFAKIVFITLILLLLLSLVAPAIFSQRTFGSPNKESLLNGLKVYVWPEPDAAKVSLAIRIHSGSAFDPQGKEGVIKMLSENLFPNETIRDFFEEDLGGSLSVTTTYDYIQIDASSRPDSFLLMLETISTAISDPAIDRETTTKLRDAMLEKAKLQAASPPEVANLAAVGRLYGTFPYGRAPYGTVESTAKIEFADLVDSRIRFLSADNATLAIYGKVDRSLALRAVRRYFGGWQKSDRRIPATFRQPDDPSAETLRIDSPIPGSAEFRMAIRGVARNDKDLAASRIFTHILENRLRNRSPEALAETLSVQNKNYLLNGTVIIGLSAGSGVFGEANGRVEAEDLILKAMSEAITEPEFQTAKNELATKWKDREAYEFWLDADTYKLKSAEADRKAFDVVTLADVRGFADRMQKSQKATVLLTAPQQAGK